MVDVLRDYSGTAECESAFAEFAKVDTRRKLIEFDGLGHAPQIQSPDEFDRRLVEAMSSP